jgi:hypothetical protein
VGHVDARHHLEHLARNVVGGSVAARRHIDLAWVGLGIGNEFRNRLDRKRGIDLHDVGLAVDARDRRDVADEVEIELIVQ